MIWQSLLMISILTGILIFLAVVMHKQGKRLYKEADIKEGFEDVSENEAMKHVVSLFLQNVGRKPSIQELNYVLDSMQSVRDIESLVLQVLKDDEEFKNRGKSGEPSIPYIVQEFINQTGNKPSIYQLNAVADIVNKQKLTEDKIQRIVQDVVSGKIAVPIAGLPQSVYTLVVLSFENVHNRKPTAQEFNMLADEIISGELLISNVEKRVRSIKKSDKTSPSFEMETIITKTFLHHTGRKPSVKEIETIASRANNVEEAEKIVTSEFDKMGILLQNVRALAELSETYVPENEIATQYKNVSEGKQRIQATADKFILGKTTEYKEHDTKSILPDMSDIQFIEATYREITGSEIDVDTLIFLMTRLRLWENDRVRVVNIIATLSFVLSEDNKDFSMRDKICNVIGQDINVADIQKTVKEWNMNQLTRRPDIAASGTPTILG